MTAAKTKPTARKNRRSPRTARRGHEERLEHILGVAARVFADEGYEKASIRKIASKLNGSLSALYYYVKSKEELLFRIQYHTFDSLVRALKGKIRGVADPEEKIRLMVESHLEHFLSHISELKVCSHELESLTGRAYRKVLEVRREYFRVTLGIIKEIRKKRGASGPDPHLAALHLFGMLNWIYMWYDPEKNPSGRKLSEQLSSLFLNGFLPRISRT